MILNRMKIMNKRTFLKVLFGGLAGSLLPKAAKADDELSLQSLNEVFAKIEEHDLKVAKIIMHPKLNEMFKFDYDTEIPLERQERIVSKITANHNEPMKVHYFGDANDLYVSTKKGIIRNGLFGHLFSAEMHVSDYRGNLRRVV